MFQAIYFLFATVTIKLFSLLLLFLVCSANPNSLHTAYEPAINEVVVPVLNRDLCNEWLDTLNVTEGMICAGYEVRLDPLREPKHELETERDEKSKVFCCHDKIKFLPWQGMTTFSSVQFALFELFEGCFRR